MNDSLPHTGLLSWPRGKAGTTAVALAVLFLIVLGLNLWTSGGGDQNGFLAFATFLAGLGALVDLILAAVAIVRRHEESLLVYLPLAIGVLAVAFVAVEIVVGHD